MKNYLAVAVLTGSLCAGAANAEVFVRIGPPPPVRVGVVGRPPYPGYVWVGGYHEWVRGAYRWRQGYWARPPYARAVWVAPAWVPRRGGWVFVPGYWRH